MPFTLSHTGYAVLNKHACVSEYLQAVKILFRSASLTFFITLQMLLCSFCYNCTGGTIRFACNTCLALA